MSAGRKTRGGVSFRVIDGGGDPVARLPLHRAPMVPREDSNAPAKGFLIGVALGLPMWWGVYSIAVYARAVMGWRP